MTIYSSLPDVLSSFRNASLEQVNTFCHICDLRQEFRQFLPPQLIKADLCRLHHTRYTKCLGGTILLFRARNKGWHIRGHRQLVQRDEVRSVLGYLGGVLWQAFGQHQSPDEPGCVTSSSGRERRTSIPSLSPYQKSFHCPALGRIPRNGISMTVHLHSSLSQWNRQKG